MRARRSVLLTAALAALLLVVGISAFAVWWSARNAQDRIAALQNAHMETNVALATVRANVYLTAILARDYLLDDDGPRPQQYIDQLSAIRRTTEQSFQVLESPGFDQPQKTALDRLRRELAVYWNLTEVVLSWPPEQKRAQRAEMMSQRRNQRNEVLGLAEQVERLVAADFTRERQRITGADREFRNTVGLTAVMALLLGLAIAGGTLAHLLSLERQSEAAEGELRRLSGQLRTAQEQERKYLSRELHDQVGQMLTGLRMELAAIGRDHSASESETAARIARAKATVEQTLRIVRNIAMLLRPSMLDDLGLAPALAWLIKEASRSGGFEIHSHIDPAVDALPDAHRTCIYRVVQEALTNASRHSGAGNVDICLTSHPDRVTATIADDGRGFDMRHAPTGMGLLGMEERIRELGGAIEIKSAPGSGTRIEFRLPRPAPVEETVDPDSDRGRSRHRPDRVETAA